MPVRRRPAALTAGALAAAAVTLLPTSTPSPAQAAPAAPARWFERVATYPVYLNAPATADPADETVAEISTVTGDGRTMIYTDAAGKRIGFIDITDPANPVGTGSLDLTLAGDEDDQPTSVAVVGGFVLVVVDTSGGDFAHPSGRLDVVRVSDRTTVRSIDLGGQPDSIAVSEDEAYVAIAMENQRDEDAEPDGGGEEGDLPQAPAGFVQVLDLPSPADPAGWTTTAVPLPAAALAGLDTPQDAEPEYVDINADHQLALSLQENNGVVVIDLATKTVESAWSAGEVTLTGVDVTDNGVFDPTATITRVREPDALQWVGDGLVATANEGDWKGGSRGWTVFEADTGEVVWDAGTSFEAIATAHGLFNGDRADNKGSEPEGLAFAELGGTPYAFVGSERSNFVAVYDMTDPRHPRFRQVLPTTNGPEGLLPVPSRDLFLTSSETDEADVDVRASVGVFRLGSTEPAFPSIASTPANGSAPPLGWTALGALSAAPGDPTHLWAASDKAVSRPRLYSVDVTGTPAVVDGVVEVTQPGGSPAALDVEGIAARVGGGFWLGSEGSTGAGNALVRVSPGGVVQQTVPLPADVASRLGAQGIEGVAVRGAGADEQVFVALQRALSGETAARIGRYDVLAGTWTWFLYPLETTTTTGDWIGLSEITLVDDDTVAVIERDKLNGPNAKVKRIYTVDLPETAAGSVTPVTKELAIDVLPRLQALRGWTQEKLEGFTIGADDQVYAVTDNDGLEDATGETQFLRLGPLTSALPDATASATSLSLSAATVTVGTPATATVTVTPATSDGTVTLLDGTTVVGTATPVAGKATFRVDAAAGVHRLTATWSGTSTRRPSTSAAAQLSVTKGVSTTTLAAKAGRKKVRLQATVTGVTGGTVTFTAGGRVLGTAPVASGVATLRTFLEPGTYRVVASYAGSATVAGSSSAPVRVKVKKKQR